MDPYTMQLLQQIQAQLQNQELRLMGLMQQVQSVHQGNIPAVGPIGQINWPLQMRAGVIELPHKDPHPFYQSIVVEPVQQAGTAFGETTAECQGSFSVDRSSPTFLLGVDACLYQTAVDQESPNDNVLNRWRPLAANSLCSPDSSNCESLMDFEWAMFFGNDDQLVQTDWLPSTMLIADSHPCLLFPVEKKISQYENITIRARPLAAAGSGNTFRLKFVLTCYKMLPQVKS